MSKNFRDLTASKPHVAILHGYKLRFCSTGMAIVILNGASRSEESFSERGGEMLRYTQHDTTALSARAKYNEAYCRKCYAYSGLHLGEEMVMFLISSPHPAPFPVGEGISMSSVKICTEQYWVQNAVGKSGRLKTGPQSSENRADFTLEAR
jgi:hypothetical protein